MLTSSYFLRPTPRRKPVGWSASARPACGWTRRPLSSEQNDDTQRLVAICSSALVRERCAQQSMSLPLVTSRFGATSDLNLPSNLSPPDIRLHKSLNTYMYTQLDSIIRHAAIIKIPRKLVHFVHTLTKQNKNIMTSFSQHWIFVRRQ